jgi:DNA invertase Pin-like site-specific DNA recombinase
MVGLISQLLNDWSNKCLRELYEALQDETQHRIQSFSPVRNPLRSGALLALDIESLIADFATGTGTRSLAIKYGISRPTVRRRLRLAGAATRLGV